MKILTAYYTHKPGGFCKRFYRMLNALCARGEEVHYICLDPPPAQLDSRIVWHKIPFPLAARKGLFFWTLFALALPAAVLFWGLRVRPARFLAFGPFYSAAALPLRLAARVPVVLFIRARPGGSPLVYLIDFIGIRTAARIVVLTRSMEEQVKRFLTAGRNKRICRLANDAPARSCIRQGWKETEPLRVLTSGVFVPGKNIALAARVFNRLEQLHPGRFLLRIAGLNRTPGMLTGESNVEVLGWREDMHSLYAESDLYLHPSLSEGMPNSLLEAMGSGLPVLASSIPELREILVHEELLFHPQAEEDLFGKLSRLTDEPALLGHWADLSRERAEAFRFDWDGTASGLVVEDL